MSQLRMHNGPRGASRIKAPPHPFPELQGPFEESMTELQRHEEVEVPSDAASRRTILLDAPTYERVIAGRWKQRPGEKYHPLWKIAAQLSFGIHLLADNLAKSEEEVMQILQGHIDEIDLFLERTTEDFALAQEDIQERMRCLQLPLQHPKVFDRMLEDRAFRNSIVEGNEKIEHIVARTGCAMRDSLKDAQKGLDATHALEQYLASLEYSWGRRNPEHEIVYEAMLENVEGWRDAFIDLRSQGDNLGQLLKQLTDVINQMQQRAGEISRMLIRAQQQPGHSPTSSRNITYIARQSASSADTHSGTPNQQSPRKPLPGVPDRGSMRQPSSLSQRCDTAQSNRSAISHRSSDMYKSRTSSRTDTNASARNSAQARLSSRSPRLVEIKRHSPHAHEMSALAQGAQSEKRASNRSNLQPIELPAESPQEPLRIASTSSVNGTNAGLGIIQQEHPTQSGLKPASPTPGLAGSSTLPLTPNSMNSNRGSNQSLAHELPSEPVSRFVPAPVVASSTPVADTASGSPPSTPGWAKQTFDTTERNRMVMSKTAFRSHPPNVDLGSPPVIFTNRFEAQTQHTRTNGSVASSIGAPGPEIQSNGSASSSPVKSKPTGITQSSTSSIFPSQRNGKKSFIAELEGTTPILLQPAVYTDQTTRDKPRETREINAFAVELEAPLGPLPTVPVSQSKTTTDSLMPSIDESQEEYSEERDDTTSVSISIASHDRTRGLEKEVAAAIRRSFIATNIELPVMPVADSPTDHTGGRFAGPSEQADRKSSERVEDIVASLNKPSIASSKLSLGGEEPLLATLPAKTYVADRQRAGPAPTYPSTPSSQKRSAATASPVSVGGLPGSGNRSRSDVSGRKSSESSASSQSQWRAFFKGQLSPSEINTSTSSLPAKASSNHKAVVELQRCGQDSSPTLGWQWAPETPEIEASGKKLG